jgi:hypothetical protein
VPRRPRSLLLKLEVRTAQRRSSCARDKSHVMVMGDRRFIVEGPGPASGAKTYCARCAREMLAAAIARLTELQATLNGDVL